MRYAMDGAGQSGRTDGGARGRKTGGTVRLGEVVQRVMAEQIAPMQSRFGGLAQAWGETVPGEMGRHCEIVEVADGQLKVRVDCPAFMYEMQLCRTELVEELRRRCPEARIKRIKFVVG